MAPSALPGPLPSMSPQETPPPGCSHLPIPPTHPIRARPATGSAALHFSLLPRLPLQHLSGRHATSLRRYRLLRALSPIDYATSLQPANLLEIHRRRPLSLFSTSTLDSRSSTPRAATLVFVSRKTHTSLRFPPAPRFNWSLTANFWVDPGAVDDLTKQLETSPTISSHNSRTTTI